MIFQIKKLLLFAFLWLIVGHLSAQSPYKLNQKKEASFLIAGGLTTGLGFYFRYKIPLLTLTDLELLEPNNIKKFDRYSTSHYSKGARKASDVLWAGSQVLPFLFLTNKNNGSWRF